MSRSKNRLWCIVNVSKYLLALEEFLLNHLTEGIDLISLRPINEIVDIKPNELLWLRSAIQ